MGELHDTNSPYIAGELSLLGITVERVTQVGDNLKDLAESFSIALARSDYIFTTGGLGPTQDDLTREAIAVSLGEKTTVSSKLLEELEEEIGIDKNQVKEIFEICVIKDKINSVYDICCIIKLRVSKSTAMKNIRKTAEYTTPKFVKIKDIPEFITRHNKNIVPTTLGLLEYYSMKN